MRLPSISFRSLAILLAFALFPLTARSDEAILSAFRDERTVTISVEQSFFATNNFDGLTSVELKYVDQPFADVAERLFEFAGIETDTGASMMLRITAMGMTHGQLYDTSIGGMRVREPTYRGAHLNGFITLMTADTHVLAHPFDGVIPSPENFMVTFGYDPYRDPSNAPFREAFAAPGGYLESLGKLVGQVYGEETLVPALSDRDPLVRRAAELALGVSNSHPESTED